METNQNFKIENRFLNIAFATLIIVYLLILAGGIVRTTKSGMGCPDWPKCYGYIIPPSNKMEVMYETNRAYKKGQMVILNDTLWVAQLDNIATEKLNHNTWKKYPKHDFADFDVTHTWIEYVNRLLGAITGLFIFAVFIAAIPFWKSNKLIVLLCFSEFILTGFQGWLGSLVVSSHLAPLKITTHMIVALLIVGVLIYCIFLVQKRKQIENLFISKKIKFLTIVALLLSVVQIIIGTQVRQEIDVMLHSDLTQNRMHWINDLSGIFFSHKNLAIMVLLINAVLYKHIKKQQLLTPFSMQLIMVIIGLEIVAGFVLNYFQVPAFMQPIHLLLASFLFGAQFYLMLKVVDSNTIKEQ